MLLVTTKGHEDEHDLNTEDIKSIQQRTDNCETDNCRDVEVEPTNKEEQIRKEFWDAIRKQMEREEKRRNGN